MLRISSSSGMVTFLTTFMVIVIIIIREVEFLDQRFIVRKPAGKVQQAVSAITVKAANAPQYGKNVVSYTLNNSSSKYTACVLYRGVKNISPPYYFGNAFYAVYTGKINGQTSAFWLASDIVSAATPSGPGSSYALAPLNIGTGKDLACFVFGIPPGSTVEILEGGIPNASQINPLIPYEVVPGMPGGFCIAYNEQAVKQYILQTGYSVTPPTNPFTEKTVLLNPTQKGVPENEIYSGQNVTAGSCDRTQ